MLLDIVLLLCIHRDVHNDNQIRIVQPLPLALFGIILRELTKKRVLPVILCNSSPLHVTRLHGYGDWLLEDEGCDKLIISSPKDSPRCVTSNQLGSSATHLLSASVLFALKLNKFLLTEQLETSEPIPTNIYISLWGDDGRKKENKEGRAAWLWRHAYVVGLLYIMSLLKVCYFTLTCQVDWEHSRPADQIHLVKQ